jgi:hypothetical protein
MLIVQDNVQLVMGTVNIKITQQWHEDGRPISCALHGTGLFQKLNFFQRPMSCRPLLMPGISRYDHKSSIDG